MAPRVPVPVNGHVCSRVALACFLSACCFQKRPPAMQQQPRTAAAMRHPTMTPVGSLRPPPLPSSPVTVMLTLAVAPLLLAAVVGTAVLGGQAVGVRGLGVGVGVSARAASVDFPCLGASVGTCGNRRKACRVYFSPRAGAKRRCANMWDWGPPGACGAKAHAYACMHVREPRCCQSVGTHRCGDPSGSVRAGIPVDRPAAGAQPFLPRQALDVGARVALARAAALPELVCPTLDVEHLLARCRLLVGAVPAVGRAGADVAAAAASTQPGKADKAPPMAKSGFSFSMGKKTGGGSAGSKVRPARRPCSVLCHRYFRTAPCGCYRAGLHVASGT